MEENAKLSMEIDELKTSLESREKELEEVREELKNKQNENS